MENLSIPDIKLTRTEKQYILYITLLLHLHLAKIKPCTYTVCTNNTGITLHSVLSMLGTQVKHAMWATTNYSLRSRKKTDCCIPFPWI